MIYIYMKNKRAFFLCFVFFFVAESSWAVPLACRTKQELDAVSEECKDNENYADAGVACFEWLKSLVDLKAKEAALKLAKSNSESLDAKNLRQTGTMQGAISGYGISENTLQDLLNTAKAAKIRVGQYQDEIIFPDGFELAEEPGFDMQEILKSAPCYNENAETLKWVEQDIDKVIKDLEKAKAVSKQLGQDSSNNKSSMNAGSLSNPMVTGTQNGAMPVAKPKGPESDISGVPQSSKSKKVMEQEQKHKAKK